MQPNLQIKESINANEGGKKNLKNLHFQRKKWKHDNRSAVCWSFYCVNDNKPVNEKCFQLMRWNICYVNLILIITAKTQARKGLILYNFTNEINALKKHVYADHNVIEKIFKEETTICQKNPLTENLHKKKMTSCKWVIKYFFCHPRFL
jgi:hypothetical protein